MTENIQKATGIVKWFSKEKGFGFISYNDKDFFVHHTDILGKGFKMLEVNQIVKFDPQTGAKGGVAKNVSVETP